MQLHTELPEKMKKFLPKFDEVRRKVAEVKKSDILTETEKAAVIARLESVYASDYNKHVPVKRKFSMFQDDNMLALWDYINNDPQRPKALTPARLWSFLTLVLLLSNRDGIVKLSNEELAEKTGLAKDNVSRARAYFRRIGVFLGDERGCVPAPERLVGAAQSTYYAT